VLTTSVPGAAVLSDLHVHVGRAAGRRVKVSASDRLTVAGILAEAAHRKGLGAVAVVDAHSPPVINDVEALMALGSLRPLPGGGLAGDSIVLFLASEVEVEEKGIGPVHYVVYLPDLEAARGFSRFLAGRVTNPHLSSQKARTEGEELALWARRAGGFLVPAHVFTPHKGFFGQGGTDLRQVFSDRALEAVPAVELGLSADADLADRVPALAGFTYLTSSDAHSPETIAREYSAILPPEDDGPFDFEALALSLRAGRLAANYGLDPRLGKYHRARCRACGHTPAEGGVPPGGRCPVCGRAGIVGGVADRIRQLAEEAVQGGLAARAAGRPAPGRPRPPYIHHIPLRSLPGVGPATVERLLGVFGTELRVLHEVSRQELAAVVGDKLALRITATRGGTRDLDISPGAGGRYGRVRPT